MSITIDGSRQTAQIEDVSERGLQIVVKNGLEVGRHVRLLAPRFTLSGEVRWCRGSRAGILLDRALSPAEQGELAGGW